MPGSEHTQAAPVRLVIVDDHPGARAGLALLLGDLEDMDLVGLAVDGEDATRLCRRMRPDVVLMDLSMPRLDGVEATRRILSERPQTRVVVVTSGSAGRLAQARAAGAVACVLKHESEEVIIEAVRAAAARGMH